MSTKDTKYEYFWMACFVLLVCLAVKLRLCLVWYRFRTSMIGGIYTQRVPFCQQLSRYVTISRFFLTTPI
jgi:hypothetical protein